jgi:hypothetical protein
MFSLLAKIALHTLTHTAMIVSMGNTTAVVSRMVRRVPHHVMLTRRASRARCVASRACITNTHLRMWSHTAGRPGGGGSVFWAPQERGPQRGGGGGGAVNMGGEEREMGMVVEKNGVKFFLLL